MSDDANSINPQPEGRICTHGFVESKCETCTPAGNCMGIKPMPSEWGCTTRRVPVTHVDGEVNVDFQDSGWKSRAEKAEQRCTELAAALDRLTTLRPASEHDGMTPVLTWYRGRCCGVGKHVVSSQRWTPLPVPRLKEGKS